MAYAVYRNRDRQTRATFPWLVEVQADLLCDLASTVVVPLARPSVVLGKSITGLMPQVRYDGDTFLLMTPELAGVARSMLGRSVGSLSVYRGAILAALDLLLTGV